MKNNQPIIPSVNFHLWEPCNMRCKFCFAGFKDVKKSILPKGHLSKEDCLKVVRILSQHFKKITFAGGEPTLCPWLPDLIQEAKNHGLTTMIVTNGSKLSSSYLDSLKQSLDWITLSIDSVKSETNIKSGRIISSNGMNLLDYKRVGELIKEKGFRLKVNTVVHRYNCRENLSELIKFLKPERWKILKVLSVSDQNGLDFKNFEITDEEFDCFLKTNYCNIPELEKISENNNEMKGSYIMVDPAGRFFDNLGDKYVYSRPILNSDFGSALSDVQHDYSKFLKRGGLYKWD
jgi:radical S-adenosyl methionine domain-containing protein 2